MQEEYQEQIGALLEQLKPKDRSAVVMHYWYDYSYEEISEALSLSVSAVKSRLHRARRTMAEAWMDAQYDEVRVERTQYESSAV